MDFDALRDRQHGSFSSWQLAHAGWTDSRIRWAARGTREVHDGVHVTGDGPLTPHQRWWAATLTAPGTWLSDESLGAFYGLVDDDPETSTVTRRGDGGIERFGTLVVRRSLWLPGEDVGEVDGLPVLSPGRTVLDLVARRNEASGRRLVRTAMRVKAVTGPELWRVLARHPGRRGAGRLRRYAKDYAHLPIDRTLSDPEAVGLAVLDAVGIRIPLVNGIIEGESADYTWIEERRIIELDSREFHHPVEDARKQAVWESRGWSVSRLPTQAVYDTPDRLIALAPTSTNVNVGSPSL
ncbi:MAG: hypothetical protein JHC95_12480 [Solirubrobacteraceae bacterium]|nr:hypothetical protein [Solirubrobacteraceae bacterium]